MNNNYVRNACEFLHAFIPCVTNWYDEDSVVEAIGKVFWKAGYHVKFELGSSRYVIVGKDFVVKWDYDFDSVADIGGCEEEYNIFKKYFNTNYRHLLAPIFRVKRDNRYFYIMPRIREIGDPAHDFKNIDAFTTKEEFNWLTENIGDLHSYNWGLINGHAIMIDYACLPGHDD